MPAALRGTSPPHSSSMRCSVNTVSLGLAISNASTVRIFGVFGVRARSPTTTSSGPSMLIRKFRPPWRKLDSGSSPDRHPGFLRCFALVTDQVRREFACAMPWSSFVRHPHRESSLLRLEPQSRDAQTGRPTPSPQNHQGQPLCRPVGARLLDSAVAHDPRKPLAGRPADSPLPDQHGVQIRSCRVHRISQPTMGATRLGVQAHVAVGPDDGHGGADGRGSVAKAQGVRSDRRAVAGRQPSSAATVLASTGDEA